MKLIRYALANFRRQLPLLSGFASNGIAMLLGLIAAPIYVRLIGIEAYGLVGFYVTLQNALQVFDFGISPTITRELARYAVYPDAAVNSRNLLRTLELIYWGIGIALGAVLWLLSSYIADDWLNAQHLSSASTHFAIHSMAILFFLQWPISFYQGGLLGLQRQTHVYTINVIFSVLKTAASISALVYFGNTIEVFFISQMAVSLLQICAFFVATWSAMPKSLSHRAQFDRALVNKTWQYSAGIGGINLLGLILIHTDRIILSRLLSLEMFGFYSLAYTISRAVSMFPNSVLNYALPRFTQAIEKKDEGLLNTYFHQSAQWLGAVLFPVGFLLILGAPNILLSWTHNAQVAETAAPVVIMLVAGNVMNHLMFPHYAIHLAYGRTKAWFYMTLGFVFAFVPLLLLITPVYGMIGAASIWALLNFSQIVIGLLLTHTRYVRSAWRQWIVKDVGLPLLLSGALVSFAIALVKPLSGVVFIVVSGIVCVLTFLICLAAFKTVNRFQFART